MLARYFYELAGMVSTEEKGLFKRCIFTLKSNSQINPRDNMYVCNPRKICLSVGQDAEVHTDIL